MKKIILICVLGLGIGFSACEKNDATGDGYTKTNVRMTDAPGAYDSVILNVEAIQILTNKGTTTLAVNSTFDILMYRNGKDTLIASQDIPSGKIQEVRLIVGATGNRVVVDGQSHVLTTPSGQSSGVKIKVHEELIAGVAYTMLLDFDAASSIVKTGNGSYILKPVIRAIPVGVSGAITGEISPIYSSPVVFAINGNDTIGTITDASGKFYFSGIGEGTYQIKITPLLPFRDTIINNVVVVNGQLNTMGVIYLP